MNTISDYYLLSAEFKHSRWADPQMGVELTPTKLN